MQTVAGRFKDTGGVRKRPTAVSPSEDCKCEPYGLLQVPRFQVRATWTHIISVCALALPVVKPNTDIKALSLAKVLSLCGQFVDRRVAGMLAHDDGVWKVDRDQSVGSL